MFGGLGSSGNEVWQRVIEEILDPIILLLFTAGFLYFVYGIVLFIQGLADNGARTTGKKHMLWGIVGMFIMVSAWGIIQMVTDTLDIDVNNPGASSGSDFGSFDEPDFGIPEEFE